MSFFANPQQPIFYLGYVLPSVSVFSSDQPRLCLFLPKWACLYLPLNFLHFIESILYRFWTKTFNREIIDEIFNRQTYKIRSTKKKIGKICPKLFWTYSLYCVTMLGTSLVLFLLCLQTLIGLRTFLGNWLFRSFVNLSCLPMIGCLLLNLSQTSSFQFKQCPLFANKKPHLLILWCRLFLCQSENSKKSISSYRATIFKMLDSKYSCTWNNCVRLQITTSLKINLIYMCIFHLFLLFKIRRSIMMPKWYLLQKLATSVAVAWHEISISTTIYPSSTL